MKKLIVFTEEANTSYIEGMGGVKKITAYTPDNVKVEFKNGNEKDHFGFPFILELIDEKKK